MTELRTLLQRHFGFKEFRPGQEEVLRHLMEGRSAAAVFPTGAGKSLCYQLPSLQLPGSPEVFLQPVDARPKKMSAPGIPFAMWPDKQVARFLVWAGDGDLSSEAIRVGQTPIGSPERLWQYDSEQGVSSDEEVLARCVVHRHVFGCGVVDPIGGVRPGRLFRGV